MQRQQPLTGSLSSTLPAPPPLTFRFSSRARARARAAHPPALDISDSKHNSNPGGLYARRGNSSVATAAE